MPIVISDPTGTKGRAPLVKARTDRLFIEDCPHAARKKNACEICIEKEMDEAIRRALMDEGYVPRDSELQED